ncbi:Early nodulin-like protein 1 [Acorus gramineus]|uniref:Early nodulin-like protein 1 n=1 Tax=Acorus gramineus TaxID=55184 RepID=A0AAV9AYW0_ACOGR|nr:Early nodulin-like protein 1 [Acorus gramineus]
MASFIATKIHSCSSSSIGVALLVLSLVVAPASLSALEFRVGGERGWHKPYGDEIETYNQWATHSRFHIGDTLYFKYMNDSVLVVDYDHYKRCNASEPILNFTNGNTTFRLDRYGFFYFISGKPGHCKAGQMLDIRVMVHPMVESPGPAPAPQSGGDKPDSGSSYGPSQPPSLPGVSGGVVSHGLSVVVSLCCVLGVSFSV